MKRLAHISTSKYLVNVITNSTIPKIKYRNVLYYVCISKGLCILLKLVFVSGISNVSNLLLGHNQLNVIEGSAFAATERIQLLILNNNPIKVFEI